MVFQLCAFASPTTLEQAEVLQVSDSLKFLTVQGIHHFVWYPYFVLVLFKVIPTKLEKLLVCSFLEFRVNLNFLPRNSYPWVLRAFKLVFVQYLLHIELEALASLKSSPVFNENNDKAFVEPLWDLHVATLVDLLWTHVRIQIKA